MIRWRSDFCVDCIVYRLIVCVVAKLVLSNVRCEFDGNRPERPLVVLKLERFGVIWIEGGNAIFCYFNCIGTVALLYWLGNKLLCSSSGVCLTWEALKPPWYCDHVVVYAPQECDAGVAFRKISFLFVAIGCAVLCVL